MMAGILKVVVTGPESTGKSTLCADLAAALDTVWVPEYARGYCEALRRPYTQQDLLEIACGQLAAEDAALHQANKLLLCDTDLYVIKVWSEHRFGDCPAKVLEQIATRQYDLYLLTGIDLPWQDDPLREHGDPRERTYFYNQYRDIVINSGVPWFAICGSREERLQAALAAIAAQNGLQ